MIVIVEGKGVGAGKSYFAVEYALTHFCRGGTVYASESLHFDWPAIKKHVEKTYGWLLQDEQYHSIKSGDIWRMHEVTPPGTEEIPVLIIVDEAQDQLNVRDFSDKTKRELFSWCCQSRHDDNDLMFISQNALNIDKQIRRLATFYYTIRNLSNFPLKGIGKIGNVVKALTLGMHNGTLFMRAQVDYDGRTVLERKLVSAKPSIWKCYHSKSMKLSRKRLGAPIAKKQLQRRKEHRPMTKFIIIGGILLVTAGAWHVFKHGIFPRAEMPKSANKVAAVISDEPVKKQMRDIYEIKTSPLRAQGNGDRWMRLQSGYYEVGRMTPEGYCEGLRKGVARVRKPDGSLLYVVADDSAGTTLRAAVPSSSSANVAVPTATPSKEIVVARWPALFPEIPERK